jgi:hypothetical protein
MAWSPATLLQQDRRHTHTPPFMDQHQAKLITWANANHLFMQSIESIKRIWNQMLLFVVVPLAMSMWWLWNLHSKIGSPLAWSLLVKKCAYCSQMFL